MFSFIRAFYRAPKIGDIYQFDKRDPFAHTWKVKIIAIKKGYVQYQVIDGSSKKYSDAISIFHMSYKKL